MRSHPVLSMSTGAPLAVPVPDRPPLAPASRVPLLVRPPTGLCDGHSNSARMSVNVCPSPSSSLLPTYLTAGSPLLAYLLLPHWPPPSSEKPPDTLLPQGLCCFLRLECSFPKYPHGFFPHLFGVFVKCPCLVRLVPHGVFKRAPCLSSGPLGPCCRGPQVRAWGGARVCSALPSCFSPVKAHARGADSLTGPALPAQPLAGHSGGRAQVAVCDVFSTSESAGPGHRRGERGGRGRRRARTLELWAHPHPCPGPALLSAAPLGRGV